MDLRYPIYLTRLLSSLIVGILIVLLIENEIAAYKILTKIFFSQEIVILNNISKFLESFIETKAMTLFSLPIYFFIGELFAGFGEYFIFDPLFNNVRSTNQFSLLEYSDLQFGDFRNLIDVLIYIVLLIAGSLWVVHCSYKSFPFILLISFFVSIILVRQVFSSQHSIRRSHPIPFKKFNKFINRKERIFALSEMYFNMHRILGGCAMTLWLLFLFWILSSLNAKSRWAYNIGFGCINLGLMIFCIIQAKNQRNFANKLIYFS